MYTVHHLMEPVGVIFKPPKRKEFILKEQNVQLSNIVGEIKVILSVICPLQKRKNIEFSCC